MKNGAQSIIFWDQGERAFLIDAAEGSQPHCMPISCLIMI